MTPQEIKDNAPEGARYYDDNGGYYYADGWFLFKWFVSEWRIISMDVYTGHLKPLN